MRKIFRDQRCFWASLTFVLCLATAAAQAAPVARSARAPEFRLTGDQITLPLVMVREFPFIEGEIAGVRGKMMLDTGADQALAINDHRVHLSGGHVNGTGHFGSGQVFQTRMNPAVNDIVLGAMHYPRVTEVQSQDATQIERITPDFIGWIGFYFWQGYAMKLDYARSQVTFYKGSSDVYLRGETVLAVIPFKTSKLPNHPLVQGTVGDVHAIAAFDTGQYGSLFTDEPTKNRLIAAGSLSRAGGETFNLTGLTMAGKNMPAIAGIDVSTGAFAAAEPIGITEKNILAIGYGFLRQYKTVWDYRSHRIYLLAR